MIEQVQGEIVMWWLAASTSYIPQVPLEDAAFPDTITEPIYTMLAYMSAIFPVVAEVELDGETLVGIANTELD